MMPTLSLNIPQGIFCFPVSDTCSASVDETSMNICSSGEILGIVPDFFCILINTFLLTNERKILKSLLRVMV